MADNELKPIEETADLNLVCNFVEAQEKLYGRRNSNEISSHFKSGTIYLILYGSSFIILFWTIIALFHFVLNVDALFLFFLLPIFYYLTRASKFYSENVHTVPTNILLNERGLRIAWRGQSSSTSNELLWKNLVHVHVEQFESKSKAIPTGEYVRLKFDLRQLSRKEVIAIKLQFLGMIQNFESDILGVLLDHRQVCISIPLDLFTLESDRLRLLSAVSQWSDKVGQTEEFQQFCTTNSEPTYTQLWLDDMQSFKRKRTRQLQENAELQNGRYQIKGRMTAGGQAQIYNAYDSHTEDMVVLKEFVLPVSAGGEVRNRSFDNVKKEAILLSGLDNDGIVKLFDHFVEDHRAYLVLEYLEGLSLRKAVKQDGPMKEELVLDYSYQLAKILQYLHEQEPSLVHRDFTPDNLVVLPEGKVKLLDFNVAHLMESDTTKTVVGKHSYMAPEQFRGKPCPQSDLYSLGCTIAYLITGKDPEPLSQTSLEIDNDVIKELVEKLTALKVEQRFQSAQSVIDFLALQKKEV